MQELIFLENPRRKRRRRMTAKQRKYFGPRKRRRRRVRRNPLPPTLKRKVRHRPVFYGSAKKLGERSPMYKLNPRRRRVQSMSRRRRSYRRNPVFGSPRSIIAGAQSGMFNALKGAGAITVNKAVSTQLARLLRVSPQYKAIVELATAMFGLPMAGRLLRLPFLGTNAHVAASVALFDAAKQYLPAVVQAQLAGYNFPALPDNYAHQRRHLAGASHSIDSGGLPMPSVYWSAN